MKQKIKIIDLINIITALLLVLNCQSVFQNATSINFHVYELCFFFIVLDSLYMVYKYGITRNNETVWFACSVIYVSILIVYVVFSVKVDDLLKFLSRFLIFPFAVLYFLSSAPQRTKYKLFKYFIEWVAIISLITSMLWFLSSFAGLKPTSEFVWKWSGDVHGLSYYFLYFSSPYQYIDFIPGLVMRRNIGIFTEGPMFMLVLSFALLFINLFDHFFKIERWKIVVILVAMITTFSVTGYIIVLMMVVSNVINKNKRIQNKVIIASIFVPFGLLAGIIVIAMKSSSASFLVRMDDFFTGVKAFISSPVVGIGYENVDALRSFMSQQRSFNMGFSNTLFSVLAYGGITLSILFLYPVCIGLCKSIVRHDYRVSTFCIIYFLLYCTVIFYTFFLNFILWGFLISYSLNRINRKHTISRIYPRKLVK